MDQEFLESRSPRISDKTLAAWEIGSVVVSTLIAEWIVLSFFGRSRWLVLVPAVLALSQMVYSHKLRYESPRQLGFRLDNFLAALKLLLIPTAAVIVMMLLMAWVSEGRFLLRPFKLSLLIVPVWALFQQYALQSYVNRRAQTIFGPGFRSVLLVALVFALMHLPNPFLSALTLLGGFFWAAVYQRQPNLFALAVSHSVASISVSLCVPSTVVNSLRVGFKYFG